MYQGGMLMAKRRGAKGEGSVYFNKARNCWVASYYDPFGERKNKYFKVADGYTRQDAENFRLSKVLEIKTGDYVREDLTFGVWMLQWLENYKIHSLKPSTLDTYKKKLAKFQAIYDVPLTQVQPIMLQHIFNKMDNANRTKHVTLTIIKGMLQKAVALGLLKSNPANCVEIQKVEAVEITLFTRDELKKIFKLTSSRKNKQMYTMLTLVANTGMRIGELASLRWKDLNLTGINQGTLSITQTTYYTEGEKLNYSTKSINSTRYVELDAHTIKTLLEYRKTVKLLNIDGFMFLTNRGNQFLTDGIRKKWRTVEIALGFKHRKFHTFRHTHVSLLLNEGFSVVDVAARIGDTPNVVLHTYAHIIPNKDKEMAKRIGNIMPH